MRIGGWKTPSMFRRYNVIDERDLAEAGERLTAFLTLAESGPSTIVPLATARTIRLRQRTAPETSRGENGQNADNRGNEAIAPVGSMAVSS